MNPLATVSNPFGVNVVVDAWNALDADVVSIHREPFELCLTALARVGRGEPDSVLLYGPAGSGKTHLLARLQRHLVQTAAEAADGTLRCVFVSAKLQASARSLWQFVRRRLALDLMREQEGVSQLVRLVAHQIAAARHEPAKMWVRGLRVLPSAEDISELVDEVAGPLGLGRGLGVVIGHLVHRRNIAAARAWLAGESLGEADLATLGVGATESDSREEDARQIVTALCRLASGSLPVVFCFDQIEALQTTADDKDSLFRFARMAAELSEADTNVLLISSIQASFIDLFDESVRRSDQDRAFRRRAILQTLAPDQVDALIRSRLDSMPEVRALRAQHAGQPDYPFAPADLKELRAIPQLVPRKVFARAFEMFARLQGTQVRTAGIDDFLADELGRRRAAAMVELDASESEQTLVHGLPMLCDVAGKPLRPSARDDVDFELDGGRAVAVCNEVNMTSLAGRFRRLVAASDVAEPRPVLVLRDPRLPISRGARKTQEYLKKLEQQGGRLIEPSLEALAALEALRTLLSDARAGDLALDGDAVGERSVRAWLVAHLDDAVKDLVDAIAQPGTAGGGDVALLRALDDLLASTLIVKLDDAAAELATDGARLRALAETASDRVGVLHGPPALLFLRVPAEVMPEGGER